MPGDNLEVQAEGKFFADPWVVATPLKKATMYSTPAISFSLMKKPASERHLTLVSTGKRSRNLSQCSMEVKPPAEQPEIRACHKFVSLENLLVVKNYAHKNNIHYWHCSFLSQADHP
jgi:hypothetical protein